MRPIPFVLFGDLPGQPTGLSRILTDLAVQLAPEQEALGIELCVVGYAPWSGLTYRGTEVLPSDQFPFKGWVFADLTYWGVDALRAAYREWFGKTRGIIMSVWDPGRCHALLELDLPLVDKWGYFAVDAENVHGTLSGPAHAAVADYQRVLAYTAYGQRVLQPLTETVVEHLPHGINLGTFNPVQTEEERAWAIETLGRPFAYDDPPMLIGCVTTNQPRKDLGLYCAVIRELISRGHHVHGWLHVDRDIAEAWSVPQLLNDYDLKDQVTVTRNLSDRHLAALYSCCVATVAPGRGEGFGYPIVESLACGCPSVHVDYAGGAEILPLEWRVKPACYHVEGPYALRRPVVEPAAMATVIEGILDMDWRARSITARQYARAYDWTTLWPQWRQWIQEGIDQWRSATA